MEDWMRTGVALGAFLALGGAAIAQDARDDRPRILTEEQYYCLVRHADTLEVSKGGTVVDITACPPEPRLGTMPRIPSERFIILSPEDIKCLVRGRRAGHNIAYRRRDNRVALYLRPCGRS
jgi:hypothetical protein